MAQKVRFNLFSYINFGVFSCHHVDLKLLWMISGISVSVVDDDLEEDTVIHHDHGKLDDSGPYEKIPDDDEEEDSVPQRPPIGQLGDFISLAGYSSEDEDLHTDHRLI